MKKNIDGVSIGEMTIEYIQDKDSCDISDLEEQAIKIGLQNAGAGNKFFIIKTERWAFNKVEDFITLLKTFESIANK